MLFHFPFRSSPVRHIYQNASHLHRAIHGHPMMNGVLSTSLSVDVSNGLHRQHHHATTEIRSTRLTIVLKSKNDGNSVHITLHGRKASVTLFSRIILGFHLAVVGSPRKGGAVLVGYHRMSSMPRRGNKLRRPWHGLLNEISVLSSSLRGMTSMAGKYSLALRYYH
jgi:hypothetical protein